MEAKIVEFYPVGFDYTQKGKFKKLGTLKVQISDLYCLMLEVTQGDKGIFFSIPRVKAGMDWIPTYEFLKKTDLVKWLQEELMTQFKNRYT